MAFALYPELMAILLYVEALEDNEVVFVEDVRQVHRIMTDSNKQKYLEPLDEPRKVHFALNFQSIFIHFSVCPGVIVFDGPRGLQFVSD